MMQDRLAELLFHAQTSVAFAILLFATQEKRHTWVSAITFSGLIIWVVLSFVLLLQFKKYLLLRAPWSVIAIVGPIAVWATIVSAKSIDCYYAGSFAPMWIAAGLNFLAVYDDKHRIRLAGQPWKDKVDIESGPR